jgi:uncharacterized protein (UPF0333 family)
MYISEKTIRSKRKIKRVYLISLIAILVFVVVGYFFLFSFPGSLAIVVEQGNSDESSVVALNIYAVNNNFWRVPVDEEISYGFVDGIIYFRTYELCPFAAYPIQSKTLVGVYTWNTTLAAPGNYTFSVLLSEQETFFSVIFKSSTNVHIYKI